MPDPELLRAWIDHIFDHIVAEPEWYLAEDAQVWSGPRRQIPELIAETFERAGELLARFSDEQLNQGFWYLIGMTRPDFTSSLVSSKVPLSARVRAVRSFVPVFEQIMSARCAPLLSHLDEPGLKPLNSACYMWWDLLRFSVVDPSPASALTSETLGVLRQILAISHDACRESALHGLGHCASSDPEAVALILDDFLTASDLRPELKSYAERAKAGRIL
jgi:hypothetical protein